MWVSVPAWKMLKVQLWDQARALIFGFQKFISLRFVVHILFPIKDVFPRDLEHMLPSARPPSNRKTESEFCYKQQTESIWYKQVVE